MKKFFALLLCMVFVIGVAAQAYAEVTLSGDARVRGIYKKDDMDATVGAVTGDNNDRYYDQRFRFTFKGENDFGAGAVYQVTATEANALSDVNDANGADWSMDDENAAYLHVPVGEMTLSAGIMPADWGMKLLKGDTNSKGVKLSGKMGENSWAAYTVKKNETRNRNIDSDNLGDYDIIGGVFKGQMGEFKIGLLVDLAQDKRAKTGTTACTSVNAADCGKGESGTTIDVTFSGAAGPASIMGEVAMKSGKVHETTNSKGDKGNPMGAVVAAGMNFDAVQATLAYAMTKNGYTADNHFMPTLSFGTAGAIALIDLGATPGGGTSDTNAIVGSAKMKINDAMTIGAALAIAKLEGYSGATDHDITEIDGTFAYAIGEGTSYNFGLAMTTVSPDGAGAKDTKYTHMYHEVSVKF